MTAPRAMLAKVHIACKELAIDDGAYRAMLARLTGHDSASKCSASDLSRVLDELKAKGWKPKVASTTRKPVVNNKQDSPAARKARALWISLHQLGVVRDGSEAALRAFGVRQLKVDALEWSDGARMYKLIEALKAMAQRAGWSQDGDLASVKARLETLLAARRG